MGPGELVEVIAGKQQEATMQVLRTTPEPDEDMTCKCTSTTIPLFDLYPCRLGCHGQVSPASVPRPNPRGTAGPSARLSWSRAWRTGMGTGTRSRASTGPTPRGPTLCGGPAPSDRSELAPTTQEWHTHHQATGRACRGENSFPLS
jgi:hypothetical protein